MLYDYIVYAFFYVYVGFELFVFWLGKWLTFVKVVLTVDDIDEAKAHILRWCVKADKRAVERARRAYRIISGHDLAN